MQLFWDEDEIRMRGFIANPCCESSYATKNLPQETYCPTVRGLTDSSLDRPDTTEIGDLDARSVVVTGRLKLTCFLFQNGVVA